MQSDSLPVDAFPACFASLPDGAILAGIGESSTGFGVRILEANATAWRPFGTGIETMHVSALCHGNGRILAGTMTDGIFEYDSLADRWRDISDGLTNKIIMDIAAGYDNDYYAASMGGGVFRKKGDSPWIAMNDGLHNLNVAVLRSANIDGPTLFAGTLGNGVFAAAIPALTATEAAPAHPALQISPPSPHPVADISDIAISLTRDGFTRLDVWDALGKRQATILDEFRTEGRMHIPWNARTLPAGIYMLRLQQGQMVTIRRFIVQR
jgi:hypothetical protein